MLVMKYLICLEYGDYSDYSWRPVQVSDYKHQAEEFASCAQLELDERRKQVLAWAEAEEWNAQHKPWQGEIDTKLNQDSYVCNMYEDPKYKIYEVEDRVCEFWGGELIK